MDSFPQLRILHISDLHFHTPTEGKQSNHFCDHPDQSASSAGITSLAQFILFDLQDDYWQQFGWAVKSADGKLPPLIVAVTGDLAHTAASEEFDRALAFLRDLSSNSDTLGSNIDVNDIFVVPGNHDVIFNKRDPKHRFDTFCTFYNNLYIEIQATVRKFARPTDPNELTQLHLNEEGRFAIAEINSSYYVAKDTFDESRGQVDFNAIKSLRAKLETVGSTIKDFIKVALVHHHPVLLPSFIETGRGVDAIMNARSLLELLKDHGFQLILHGHKHFPQVFSYDPDPAWADYQVQTPQLIVAGGSAGSTELPVGTKRSNTYNVITIKWIPKALQARVQVVT